MPPAFPRAEDLSLLAHADCMLASRIMSSAFARLPKHLRDAMALAALKKVARQTSGPVQSRAVIRGFLGEVDVNPTRPRMTALGAVVREERKVTDAQAKKRAASAIKLGVLFMGWSKKTGAALNKALFWQVTHAGTRPQVRSVKTAFDDATKITLPQRDAFTNKPVKLTVTSNGGYRVGKKVVVILGGTF